MLAYVVGGLVVVASGYMTLILFLRLISPRPTPATPSSLRYLCALDSSSPSSSPSRKPRTLPSTLSTPASLELSVVVPAFDEERRLKEGLKDALEWLEERRMKEGKLQGALDKASQNAGRATPTGTDEWPSPGGTKRRWRKGSYEVVIVDDGSRDRTVHVALEIAKEHAERVRMNGGAEGEGEIRVVKLGKNRGKGGAVRHGMLHSRGARILFADADGASRFADLEKLLAAMDRIRSFSRKRRPSLPPDELPTLAANLSPSSSLDLSKWASGANGEAKENGKAANSVQEDEDDEDDEEEQGLVLGSRAHLVTSPSVVARSPLRNFLMRAFHLYLYVLGVRAVKDTQCGFKLLTRGTVRDVVAGLHVEGWIFDVELLLLSSLLDPPVPVVEVPITWSEVGGSKLSVVRDSVIMAIELLMIRLNYTLGVWMVPRKVARRGRR